MAFLWFVCWAAIPPIRNAVATNMIQYDEIDAYGTFELADVFMNNLWQYILVIVFVALVMFVALHAQRKGEVMVVR